MGAYGSRRTKGMDVLGAERQFVFREDPKKKSKYTSWPAIGWYAGKEVWSYSRSECGPGSGLEGSPYRPNDSPDPDIMLLDGNPNGISDGLILVLSTPQGYLAPTSASGRE